MAKIDIVSANGTDAAVLTRLGTRAFANDLINDRVNNTVNLTPEQVEEHVLWRIKRNERRIGSPSSHWFKAIDSETGKAVGYTGIQEPETESGKAAGADTNDTGMPAMMDRELYAQIGETTKGLKEKCLGERKDFWCKFAHSPCSTSDGADEPEDVPSMAVEPTYQGQGIAKQLLQKICELADKAGQDIYLESTKEGLSLYTKAGFEKVGEAPLLDGAYTMMSMLRKSKQL